MHILLIEPNKIPRPRNIADTLKAMQHIVSGTFFLIPNPMSSIRMV